MADKDIYIDNPRTKMMFDAIFAEFPFHFRERRYSSNSDHSPIRRRSVSPEIRKGEILIKPCERFQGKQKNYSEIADKNAQELISEEEKAKIKAEKKKAKKERQKLKKDNEKIKKNNEKSVNINNIEKTINKMASEIEDLSVKTNCKDTERLDINAAFISRAIKKVKHVPIIPEKTSNEKVAKDINSIIKTAVEYENNKQFKEAVQYLSDALNLSPKRFDLILKRSFLYYKLAKFEKSIRDAEKALQYSPNNPDGYLRLAEAHFALNNLSDAEVAFTKLLKHNSYCEEARNRLFSIRIKQLEDMGYHPNKAFTALFKSKNQTLDEAIDYLTALESGKETADDLYYSDEDESEEDYEDDDDSSEGACGPLAPPSPPKPVVIVDKRSPLLTDPSNPLGCCSIFVGNLKKGITYKEVQDVFKQFGEITSIKLTSEPNCYAFVNFEESDSAGRAMAAMQGSLWLLSTVPLVIKYPTNNVNKSLPTLNNPELLIKLRSFQTPYYKQPLFKSAVKSADKEPVVMKLAVVTPTVPPPAEKAAAPNVPVKEPAIAVVKPPASDRPRPSPQTEECFYWRTTGCAYGKKCFNLHISGHEGIGMKIRKPFHH